MELVLLDNGHAFTPSGQYLGKTGVSGVLAASPDGRQLMAGDRGSGANVHRCADPRCKRRSRYDAALTCNPEGTRVFNDACAQFDAATLSRAVTGTTQ
ncbi:hypothetical protein [Aquabacterium sp.]|uniref:hypothetical protein n=1 Tax=Aquabacterium sp. TaxID=1872578 RepID=UPI0037852ED6